MGTAVIYARISRDVSGTTAGVERQRQDCLDLCQRRGWAVGEVLTDNDISAYSGKHRPGYARALELIQAGDADVLVAWHPDRLHRSPIELERFVDIVEAHRVQVATVTAGDVDLSTPEGRLMARITGAVARKESEDKSRRLRRKHRELAEQGKVSGGGPRPFGFADDRIAHNPTEAKLIKEAARRVLAGDSLYAIVNDWTARGVSTVTGKPWTTTHIRTFLTSPRVAGLRQRGEEIFPAVWKPILDQDTWKNVGRVLRSRSRARTRPPRSYLLSGGIARCGKCGAALVAAPRPYGRAYACLKESGGCNSVSIKAEPVEQLIEEHLFDVLDTPVLEAHVDTVDTDSITAELADIDARMKDLSEMFADGDITRAEWQAARDGLDKRREGAEARVAASVVDPLDGYRDAKALRRAWNDDMPIDRKRSIVATIIGTVTIAPAGRAGGKVDLSRVTIPKYRA